MPLKVPLLRNFVDALNNDAEKQVRLRAYVCHLREILLSRPHLFKGSFSATMEHEVLYLNIISGLVDIQVYLGKNTSRVEAFRYWLVSALVLKSLFAQIEPVSGKEGSETVYGCHASYFHKAGELFLRMATLMTLLATGSGQTSNPQVTIDSLLALDPLDILILPEEILHPYVSDLNVFSGLLRVTRDAIAKNYGPSWRFYSIELLSFIKFLTAALDQYEARNVLVSVWPADDSAEDGIPDLSIEDLSRLFFGASEWPSIAI